MAAALVGNHGANAVVFVNSVADFSGTQGFANWYYGYYTAPFNPSTFTPMPQFGTVPGTSPGQYPDAWLVNHSTFWTFLGPLLAHPNGPITSRTPVEHWAVRRWVSQSSCTVVISTWIADYDSLAGDGVILRIFIDGTEVFSQILQNGNTTGLVHRFSATIEIGSIIDFAIAPRGSDYHDTTALAAIISDQNVRTQTILLDPRSTYLRYNAIVDVDPDPSPPDIPPQGPAVFDLSANGIIPDDYLFLERSGRFKWSSEYDTEEGRNVWAVFSSDGTVLDNPTLDNASDHKRIPGALPLLNPPENVSAIVTGKTLPNGNGDDFLTDILQDFMADRVLVNVPDGATHLMFGAGDVKWADNLDGPPADFQMAVTQIRDPDFDTDGDGAADLDEFLFGTDYADPNSRPSLTLTASPTPGQVRAQWTAQPFRLYEMEQSSELSSWRLLESIGHTTVPTVSHRDYPLTPDKRFFQLRIRSLTWD